MRYVFEKALDGVHRCSSKIQIYIFERSRWMGCTGAVPKSGHIFFKGHVGSLDGVHRCRSKGTSLDMCLKQRWMGCTGAVRKSRYIFFKGHVGSLDGVHRCRSKGP